MLSFSYVSSVNLPWYTCLLISSSSHYCQVWPIEVDMKFLEPVGKELKLLGKVKNHSFFFYALLSQAHTEDLLISLFAFVK